MCFATSTALNLTSNRSYLTGSPAMPIEMRTLIFSRDELTEPSLHTANRWKRFGKRVAQLEDVLGRHRRAIQRGKQVAVPFGDCNPTLGNATGHVGAV